MLNVNIADFRNNLGDCLNRAAAGETIAISGADAVLLSRTEYEQLAEVRRNEFFAKLDRGLDDIRAGKGITVSVEELERFSE
jgi:prevent-host-death family protein